MDDETRRIYDGGAEIYASTRPSRFDDRARALVAGRPDPSLPVIDAGCGTGAYLPHLGAASIGLDGSAGMLRRAALDHDRPLARARLERLPVRSGSIGAWWARNSYVHLDPGDTALALAEAHRALVPGAPLSLSMLAGDDEAWIADDDLPGRTFHRWSDEALHDTVVGAGFDDVVLDGDRPRFVRARRARSLPDTVRSDLRLLICGLNPSLHAADAGVGFVSPSNRFWPAALAAGLVSRDRDPFDACRRHRVGMTDLVKRATRRADELSTNEYRDGLARVERLCRRLAPAAVCMVGLGGWRAAVDRRSTSGWQEQRLGSTPVYVMPSTSGLNAHARLDDLVEHLRRAAAPPAATTRPSR